MNRNLVILAVILAVACLLCGIASAKMDSDKRSRRTDGPRIVTGEIISISDTALAVKPVIPAELEQKMLERGRELPEVPDRIDVVISENTKFRFQGEDATQASFSPGDIVVIIPAKRSGDEDAITARMVVDEASAREFMQNRRGERGDNGPGGQGRGDADGPGRGRGMRPVFGEITSIDGDLVTIHIEIPDFVRERMEERGRGIPEDLPVEVTLMIGERTKYFENGTELDENPFGVGSRVAAMARRGDGDVGIIIAMSDYATARERMEQGPQREPGPDGEGGPGPRGGRRGDGPPRGRD